MGGGIPYDWVPLAIFNSLTCLTLSIQQFVAYYLCFPTPVEPLVSAQINCTHLPVSLTFEIVTS